MNGNNIEIFLVVGPPYGGKSTYISKNFDNIPILEIGEIVRTKYKNIIDPCSEFIDYKDLIKITNNFINNSNNKKIVIDNPIRTFQQNLYLKWLKDNFDNVNVIIIEPKFTTNYEKRQNRFDDITIRKKIDIYKKEEPKILDFLKENFNYKIVELY